MSKDEVLQVECISRAIEILSVCTALVSRTNMYNTRNTQEVEKINNEFRDYILFLTRILQKTHYHIHDKQTFYPNLVDPNIRRFDFKESIDVLYQVQKTLCGVSQVLHGNNLDGLELCEFDSSPIQVAFEDKNIQLELGKKALPDLCELYKHLTRIIQLVDNHERIID